MFKESKYINDSVNELKENIFQDLDLNKDVFDLTKLEKHIITAIQEAFDCGYDRGYNIGWNDAYYDNGM